MDDALKLWSLSAATPIADTPTSRVYRVRQRDGELAALKLLRPYGADELTGGRLMQWWDGDGAARIFAIDGLAILMEWLDGGPLGDLVRLEGRDADATAVLCDVLAGLHRPHHAPPRGLDSLRRSFAPLLDGKPEDWPPPSRPDAARAHTLATELFATTTDVLPLHGDLHHDNVVGSTRGWLAIDPKGLLGDRHYDVANIFRNPYGADALAHTPARIETLADTFSRTLGLNRKRTLQWAAAHCALSEYWNKAVGNESTFNVTMLPLLLEAVDRST